MDKSTDGITQFILGFRHTTSRNVHARWIEKWRGDHQLQSSVSWRWKSISEFKEMMLAFLQDDDVHRWPDSSQKGGQNDTNDYYSWFQSTKYRHRDSFDDRFFCIFQTDRPSLILTYKWFNVNVIDKLATWVVGTECEFLSIPSVTPDISSFWTLVSGCDSSDFLILIQSQNRWRNLDKFHLKSTKYILNSEESNNNFRLILDWNDLLDRKIVFSYYCIGRSVEPHLLHHFLIETIS